MSDHALTDALQLVADSERPVTSGTSYWIHQDSGYTTVSERTRPEEPAGMVRVQYPDHAGWSRDTMLAFLASVHVNPDARPGHG